MKGRYNKYISHLSPLYNHGGIRFEGLLVTLVEACVGLGLTVVVVRPVAWLGTTNIDIVTSISIPNIQVLLPGTTPRHSAMVQH